MKFTVNKDDFIQNLTIADSIINIKSPLAMLLNVYIEARKDGTITLLSYNGENGVKVDAAGTVEAPGKITLLSKKLLEAVRRIPGDKIVLRTRDENSFDVLIHPEKKENPIFTVNGVSGDAYPVFKEFQWDNFIKISQETLKEQIASTEFSVSTDASKPAFTGSYVEEAVEGSLSFVTSDGKRLSVIIRPYEEKKGSVELGVIIPERIFKTIHPILSTGYVIFSTHNNQAFFKIGNVYMFSNLVEGKFPNYRDVIPSEKVNVVTLDSSVFLEALETVSVMSDPDTGRTKIEIDAKKMTVQTSNQIYGVAKEEIEIQYKGSPISVAFNYKAIVDFLKVVSGKKIEFVINSQSSPLMMQVIGDEHFTYISMPLKLND